MFFEINAGQRMEEEDVPALMDFYAKKFGKNFPPFNESDFHGVEDFINQLKLALAGEDLEQIKTSYHRNDPDLSQQEMVDLILKKQYN